jgi:hypothetical protein
MSFKTDEVIAFAKSKELPARVVASIEARAREAARDYPGRDGNEFAHGKLPFVLGRELADQYRAVHRVPA